MASFNINQNTNWVQPKQIYINTNTVWTPVKALHINKSGTWHKVYPDSGTLNYTQPGNYFFTVPSGIYRLSVTYPTTATMVTTAIDVTPGQLLPVNIGTFGATSKIGQLQAPAYDIDIFDILTEVNDSLIVQLGVTTSTTTVQSFTGSSGPANSILGQLLDTDQSDPDNQALETAAGVAGFYVSLAYDSLGGRQAYHSTISLHSVPISTVVNDLSLYVIACTGPSAGCSILQNPAASNSYVGGFVFSDPAADPHQCNAKIGLRQIVNLSLAWGDNYV